MTRGELSVIVVGGGIGGLAAGAALCQAGFQVTVLEQSNNLRGIGAGVTLWPNAYRALAALGIADRVARAGALLDIGTVMRANGAVLTNSRLDLRQRFGAPALCVRRGELLQALSSRVPEDGLFVSSRVNGFEQDADGVAAILESGARVSGDVLIGADGLGSIVRRQLGRAAPRFAGALAWRGLASGHFGDGLVLGHHAHAGWMPADGDSTYWFACINATEASQPLEGSVTKELEILFGGWTSPIPSLIAATAPELILRHDLYEHPSGDAWGQGRVTLLGDAAHAMTPALGQGAGSTLEDAVVLARCLEAATVQGATPERALRSYERRRRARVARLQRTSARFLRIFQPSGRLGETARNLIMRVPARLGIMSQGWQYRYDPERG